MPADVEGLARLVDTLDGVIDELEIEGPQAEADLLEPAVVAATPRKTGALAATVTAQVSEGLVTVVAGSPTVQYAGRVHGRNPWIARTIDQRTDDLVDAYTAQADKALAKVKGI